jgi:hypothetical protein
MVRNCPEPCGPALTASRDPFPVRPVPHRKACAQRIGTVTSFFGLAPANCSSASRTHKQESHQRGDRIAGQTKVRGRTDLTDSEVITRKSTMLFRPLTWKDR